MSVSETETDLNKFMDEIGVVNHYVGDLFLKSIRFSKEVLDNEVYEHMLETLSLAGNINSSGSIAIVGSIQVNSKEKIEDSIETIFNINFYRSEFDIGEYVTVPMLEALEKLDVYMDSIVGQPHSLLTPCQGMTIMLDDAWEVADASTLKRRDIHHKNMRNNGDQDDQIFVVVWKLRQRGGEIPFRLVVMAIDLNAFTRRIAHFTIERIKRKD